MADLAGCGADCSCPGCIASILPFFRDPSDDFTVNDLFSQIHNHNLLNLYVDEDSLIPVHSDKYCSPYHFENFKAKFQRPNISIIHVNIRSLRANFTKLKILLASLSHPFDIIIVTETWLTNDTCNLFQLHNYNFISQNRERRGGGVGMFIRNHIQYDILNDFTMSKVNSHDSLFIKVYGNTNSQLTIGGIYRPPSGDLNTFLNLYLSQCLEHNQGKILIGGDFNINLLNYDSDHKTQEFLDLIHSNGFLHLITQPTRVSTHSASLIDNFFTNINQPSYSLVISDDISDHFPIACSLPFSNSAPKNLKSAKAYVLSQGNIRNLKQKLQSEQWDEITTTDPSEFYTALLNNIKNALDSTCLTAGRPRKTNPPKIPWLDNNLTQMCKTKNALYKKFVTVRTPEAESNYKKCRNALNTLLRKAKRNYFVHLFDCAKSNSKRTWKLLNNLLNYKKIPTEVNGPILDCNNKLVKSKQGMANIFNDFFSEIGSKIATQIPQTDEPDSQYLPDHFPHSIFLQPVTNLEISSIYKNMKDSNAIDVNGLSKSIFDNIIDDLLPQITKLCNLSFEAGIFPEGMKVGKIIPIYKSGSKKICSNYRPISILPFLSKILEKLYNSWLYNFLQTYELLNASQYGFRKNMSTSQAATDYFETITDILKSNKAAISVSLDLTKAFDSLSHKVLLKKLHHYGIRGVAHTWLKSYLTDRQQTLTLARGEIHSNYKTITHGVPQGSVLGPTLFLIYINDIINSSNIFKYILFADDTTLIYGFDPSSDPSDDINSGLNNTQKWLNCNKLALNVNKTQAILYGKTTHKPVIRINNEPIHFVDQINLLGTIFDKNLTFKPHIAKICSKASRALGLLNQSKGLLPKYIKRTIYFSLIHPHLSQSIELLGNTAKSTMNPIINIAPPKSPRLTPPSPPAPR